VEESVTHEVNKNQENKEKVKDEVSENTNIPNKINEDQNVENKNNNSNEIKLQNEEKRLLNIINNRKGNTRNALKPTQITSGDPDDTVVKNVIAATRYAKEKKSNTQSQPQKAAVDDIQNLKERFLNKSKETTDSKENKKWGTDSLDRLSTKGKLVPIKQRFVEKFDK